MSSDWLPVLVVLGLGALLGLFLARRLGRHGTKGASRSRKKTKPSRDELRLADLEQRREELYAQLKRSSNEADRRQLEDQAARVLRELDSLGGSTRKSSGRGDRAAVPVSDSTADSTGASGGHPMLVGFLGGAAMVGLVGLLIYFAVRDAQPQAPEGAPASGSMAGAAAMGAEHPGVELPPEVQARIDALRQRVAADPTDIVARKQLALSLLASEQFFEAFQMANEIVSERPGDPDGLYVQGMVRMTMGQDDAALANLDQVLEQYPNHILALAGRGMIFMRRGDREAAILVWERAMEAAGGSHPDLEQLLAMARDPAQSVIPADGGGAASSGPPETAAAAPRRPEAPAPSSTPPAADHFGVRVELASGVAAPRGAILFVFLREGQAGAPSAVKRIQSPVFPLELSLGPGDSMMGRPLPQEGMVTVRLDADGSATTRGPEDLAAEIAAKVGTAVRLVLGE